MERLFTREEAEAKIGKNVIIQKDIPGVTKGTTGSILKYDRIFEGYGVKIKWNIKDGPLCDWATKDDYERFLTEID